ncbi:vomeronasal type-1 receptor 4-like [Tachyglossus aculeatus]|uniref:vomeronasal type-1 receptor 4-like n=1 Tax=Tachyglossus aculeatus TaxID=9261 RepID=UPI0018F4E0CB|nr:vomeronasal type-1 receptor 4-like [Tachyglossus aculeatus]
MKLSDRFINCFVIMRKLGHKEIKDLLLASLSDELLKYQLVLNTVSGVEDSYELDTFIYIPEEVGGTESLECFCSFEEIRTMPSNDLIWGVLFTCQTGIGILGNSALLTIHGNIFLYQSQQKKPTDLIITLLTVANMIVLLTRGVPMAMASFGMRNIVDEVGCLALFFVNRVSRGLSICITCLLSMFQAITISPSTSHWGQLKPRAPNYIIPSLIFFCILNFFIYLGSILTSQFSRNVSDSKYTLISKTCSILPRGTGVLSTVCLNAMTLRDLLFMGLMSWASGYMVIVLYRHRKQVRHIRGTGLSPKSSVETRASHTILLLVTCFVTFYWMNCSTIVSLSVQTGYSAMILNATSFLSTCYPLFCPLLLISTDARVPIAKYILRKLRSSSARSAHVSP